MRKTVVNRASLHRWCHGAAVLFCLRSIAGCERAPAPGGGILPPAQAGVAAATPAADAPVRAVPATAAARTEPPANAMQPTATSQASEDPPRFIAYYFHRTMRCATCLSIEEQSREAIEQSYGGELGAGRLEWWAVNIEEPGNEHFEADFQLQSQLLVLVEMSGEQVTRWRLLPKVWELVEEPHGFQEFVATEVGVFLGGE